MSQQEISAEEFQGNKSIIKPGRINDELGSLKDVWDATRKLGCAIQVYTRKGASLVDAYQKAVPEIHQQYPNIKDSQHQLITTLLLRNWNRGPELSRALIAAEKDAQQTTNKHEQPAAHV